ncbi:MAG: aminoacyl-tRNA hydrolase [Deltaproteobacteria bacterium]|nr:aminoacyl-tRNA hydrolase [Deltaproteobacteria bacterium]
MKLIIGLGNPGNSYLFTRHNMGFLVLDDLARQESIAMGSVKFDSQFGRGTVSGVSVILAKPQTFMNLAGIAAGKLVSFFKLDAGDIIVIHDDLDFPLGDVRVKLGGGDGGHKGIRSIIDHLGSPDFVRVRLGIGRPNSRYDIESYVLKRFSEEEMREIPAIITVACDAVTRVVSSDPQRAMNEFNIKNTKNLNQEV